MSSLIKRSRNRLILLDNIDSITGGKRDGRDCFTRLTAFITALPHHVFVVATSNRVSSLEEIVRGIFDIEVETNMPKAEDRFEILKSALRRFPHHLNDDDINKVIVERERERLRSFQW